MGPVARASYVAVLYRIVMKVVHVTLEIAFPIERVFPIAALPDAAFPPFAPGVRDDSFGPAAVKEGLGEFFLNSPPAQGVTVITRGQSPDRMQMIGQENDGGCLEGPACTNRLEGITQASASQLGSKDRSPFMGNDSKEVHPT